MQQAPVLLAALQQNPNSFPHIEEVLNRGYDPGLLQGSFGTVRDFRTGKVIPYSDPDTLEFAANVLDNSLNPVWKRNFPSDWADESDLINLAERKLYNPDIVMSDSPALESAANMYNNGLALGDMVLPPGQNFPGQGGQGGSIIDNFFPEENIHEPEFIPDEPFPESDLDDIHSYEMRESGKRFPNELRKWYRKNKR